MTNETMTTEFSLESGFENEPEHRHMDSGGGSHSAAADVNQFLEKFDFGDLLASADTFVCGDDEGDNEMDSVPDEEVQGLPLDLDQESALAAFSGVPIIGTKKGRGKEGTLKTFTEEDFEDGAERLAFLILKSNVDALFNKKSKPDDYIKATRWLFGRYESKTSMETCCLTLGVRKDVLRLRIHYEFWRRWVVLPIEFPFLTDPVPDVVEGEIFILAGQEGFELSRAAWMQPGIRTSELIEKLAPAGEEQKYVDALQTLSEKYILSRQGDSWYLTGRNPSLRAIDIGETTYRLQRHHVSWSKMF